MYLIIFLSLFLKTGTQGTILHGQADRKFDEYYERPVNVSTTVSKWQCMGEKTKTLWLQTTPKDKVQTNNAKVVGLTDNTSDKLVPEKEQKINNSDGYFK